MLQTGLNLWVDQMTRRTPNHLGSDSAVIPQGTFGKGGKTREQRVFQALKKIKNFIFFCVDSEISQNRYIEYKWHQICNLRTFKISFLAPKNN